MTAKKTIYFLCTGNSCRSQMAEGFGKHFLEEGWDVYSAGIEAHGVNPKAVQAMAEVDIDISGQTSNVIDMELLRRADVVVTLCGHANEVCPAVPAHVRREHWGFDDPAGQDWSVVQRVRDEIGARIKQFAELGYSS
ncbi:arsenate reductase (thioredoxin) [Paenibacillus profundus]|uniref:Arsenate reductase n=1 Tax=Paenibacillus profundus TaxID=1173085 RepID=A0ABS8YIF6_9BACL|nr:arsenate reductase (thioredoxin) [Paenibacillus profundus]MCE5171688.1 arsenate reductase (thioredoxin) [Paenibacillus profundus]